MATNDFQVFAGGSGANVLSQSDWLALAALGSGFSAGVAQSAACNKAWRQSSTMAAVLAQLIVDITGQNATDDGTTSTLLANLKSAIRAQSLGVVGSTRNLVMSIAAASASGSLSADEIVVETALGGLRYCLTNFNKTINLATTGAGGMDTGTAPVSGFVALYAIYNPSTQIAALLATNATSSLAPNVYGGANMPSGYTASALVSVWPTNSSSQLVAGYQADRTVNTSNVSVLSTSTAGSHTAFSIAGAVPMNARSVSGNISFVNTTASAMGVTIFGSVTGIGQAVTSSNVSASEAKSFPFANLPIVVAQTLYYSTNNSAGTPTYGCQVSSYSF